MIWQDLTHPVVRDLAWACFSPPLLITSSLPGVEADVDNCRLAPTPARLGRLCELDREPAPLLEHLENNGHSRLGLYFEALWHFFLTTDPDTELLAHNVAVREGGRTLGEFDILYLCKRSGRHTHLELAVKFYLGIPGSKLWLGPGQRDRLDVKTAHLAGKQIQLGRRPQARALLDSLDIPKLHREIELKGYLFRATAGDTAPPAALNAAGALGDWHTLEQFRSVCARDPQQPRWRMLPRERWLAPALVANTPAPATSAALIEALDRRFRHGGGPQMLVRFDRKGCENRRCFITPANWPDARGMRSPLGGWPLKVCS